MAKEPKAKAGEAETNPAPSQDSGQGSNPAVGGPEAGANEAIPGSDVTTGEVEGALTQNSPPFGKGIIEHLREEFDAKLAALRQEMINRYKHWQ